MEVSKYVEINETGSAVIAGTRIHVETVAHAYSGGYSEQEILAWLKIDKVQFHGSLAYYYEHRDEIEQRITGRAEQAKSQEKVEQDTIAKLRQKKENSSLDT